MAHTDDERDGVTEQPRADSAANSQPDISQMHTSRLRLPNDDISHLHATPLTGPGAPQPDAPVGAAHPHPAPPPTPPALVPRLTSLPRPAPDSHAQPSPPIPPASRPSQSAQSAQSARSAQSFQSSWLPLPSASPPPMPPTPAVPHAEGTHFLTETNASPLVLPDTPSNPGHSDMLADADRATQARAQREANLAEAQRWRMQADELGALITRDTDYFSTLTARWRELVHMPRRSRQDDFDLAQLEVEVPRYSQRLARARKRWTECLERAREYEDRARRLR